MPGIRWLFAGAVLGGAIICGGLGGLAFRHPTYADLFLAAGSSILSFLGVLLSVAVNIQVRTYEGPKADAEDRLRRFSKEKARPLTSRRGPQTANSNFSPPGVKN